MNLRGKHKCIENVSRQNCPICLEDIHTSRVVAHVLPCGHLLHRTCYEEMLKEGYRCPLCMHSALDMTRYWRQLDNEVAQTPMPSEYQNVTVDILCNDCNGRSTVQFHILGMKCKNCDSYNTAQAGSRRVSVDQQWATCSWLEEQFCDVDKACIKDPVVRMCANYALEMSHSIVAPAGHIICTKGSRSLGGISLLFLDEASACVLTGDSFSVKF